MTLKRRTAWRTLRSGCSFPEPREASSRSVLQHPPKVGSCLFVVAHQDRVDPERLRRRDIIFQIAHRSVFDKSYTIQAATKKERS